MSSVQSELRRRRPDHRASSAGSRADPKPFFGTSDNTNLLVFLHNLGIVAYHGARRMTELGRPFALHPLTADSVRAALFISGPYAQPVDGWIRHQPDQLVEGCAWGVADA